MLKEQNVTAVSGRKHPLPPRLLTVGDVNWQIQDCDCSMAWNFFYICCPTAIRIIKKRNMEEINCINRSHYRIMTCTDLDTSKVFKTSKCRRPRSIDSFCHFSMNPTYTCKTTYVQPFSVPVQVLSLGWTVQKSPIRAGWAAHSQEQPVDTYWETQAFNGKQQETATKDCLSSASLVCVLNHTL